MNAREDYADRKAFIDSAARIRVEDANSTAMVFDRSVPGDAEIFRILSDGYTQIIQEIEDQIQELPLG